jgi:hypothetical protein
MPDYRSMFERLYLGSWDLQGRDWVLQISKVVAATLTAPGGRTSKKPVVFFEQTDKGLALNKTNAKTIAAMYGNNTDEWVGELVTVYPTQTSFGAETVEAIRIRPTKPKTGAKPTGVKSQPVDPAIREKQNRAAEAADKEPTK